MNVPLPTPKRRNQTVLGSPDPQKGILHTKRVQSLGRTRGEAMAMQLQEEEKKRKAKARHTRRSAILASPSASSVASLTQRRQSVDGVVSFSSVEFRDAVQWEMKEFPVDSPSSTVAVEESPPSPRPPRLLVVDTSLEVENEPFTDDDDNDDNDDKQRDELFDRVQTNDPTPPDTKQMSKISPMFIFRAIGNLQQRDGRRPSIDEDYVFFGRPLPRCLRWRALIAPWLPIIVVFIVCWTCNITLLFTLVPVIPLVLNYLQIFRANVLGLQFRTNCICVGFYVVLQLGLLILADRTQGILTASGLAWFNCVCALSMLVHALIAWNTWLEMFMTRAVSDELP